MDPRRARNVSLLLLGPLLACAEGSPEPSSTRSGAPAAQEAHVAQEAPPSDRVQDPELPAAPEAHSAPFDLELVWTLYANPRPLANASFGHACAVGDLDGDGHGDLVVGAPGMGTVFVFPGREGGLPDPGTWRALQSEGSVAGEFGPGWESFGSALALGQLDGDRALELVIGAPGRGEVPGRLWTVGVGEDPWALAPVPSGPDPLVRLGHAVAVVDLDGDGVGEIVGGAPGTEFDGVAEGAVLVVHRGATHLLRSPRPSLNANFGHDFALARSSGSRREDLLVSAVGNQVGEVPLMGEVLRFRGELFDAEGADPLVRYEDRSVPGYLAPTHEASDPPRFGMSVHAAGKTLAVGSPRHDRPGVQDAGLAFAFDLDGGPHPESLPRPTPLPSDVHGFRVRAGNLLGHGQVDVAVACLPRQKGDPANPYSVVVYPGGRAEPVQRPLAAPAGARDHWIQGAAVGCLLTGGADQLVAGDPSFDGAARRSGRVAVGAFRVR